jgi:hypothetical protein
MKINELVVGKRYVVLGICSIYHVEFVSDELDGQPYKPGQKRYLFKCVKRCMLGPVGSEFHLPKYAIEASVFDSVLASLVQREKNYCSK